MSKISCILQNVPLLSDEYRDLEEENKGLFGSIKEVFVQFIEELLEPPTISAVCYLELNPLFLVLCLKKLRKCSKLVLTDAMCISISDFGFCCGCNSMAEVLDYWRKRPFSCHPRDPPTIRVNNLIKYIVIIIFKCNFQIFLTIYYCIAEMGPFLSLL